jgi:hypothetical protein
VSAANRTRGLVTEQMTVRWFRDNGFPHAERTVRTGYRVATRELADAGDLGLCPGAIVAVKSLRPVNRAERAVPGWLAETEAQRVAASAEVALLVVRRDGTADVGEWWAWLTMHTLGELLTTWTAPVPTTLHPPAPVRLLVADGCRLLRAAGYGSPESTKFPELTPSPPSLPTEALLDGLRGTRGPGNRAPSADAGLPTATEA